MVVLRTPGQLTAREKYRAFEDQKNIDDAARDIQRDHEAVRKWMNLAETGTTNWAGPFQIDTQLYVGQIGDPSGGPTGGGITAASLKGWAWVQDPDIPISITPSPGVIDLGPGPGSWFMGGNDGIGMTLSGGGGLSGASFTMEDTIGNTFMTALTSAGSVEFTDVDVDLNNNDLIDVGDCDGEDGLKVPFDAVTGDARRAFVKDWFQAGAGSYPAYGHYNNQVPSIGPFPTGLSREGLGSVTLPQAVKAHATSHTLTVKWLWWTDGTSVTPVDWQIRMFAIYDTRVIPLSSKFNVTTTKTPAAATVDYIQSSTITTAALDWTTRDVFYSFRFNRRGDTDANGDNVYIHPNIELKWNGDITG